MKKLLILILLTGTIWSCNNHKPKNFNNAPGAGESRSVATSEQLELNNGVKWKADSTTNNNINNLKLIFEKFDNRSDRSLAGYKKAQDDLQKGLDKIIAECKMKGPDHEALHKWLEPLIDQVTKFKQVSAVPDADEALKGVRTQVNLYARYFAL